NPATPTLTTTASGPVIVGSKIHDVAHLSAGSAPLGGSIALKVYAPGDTTCATPTAVTPDVPVSGANDYTSADFTTTQTGVYRWRAFYSGDSNNNAVSTPCNDANESSTVNPDTPTLTTNASGPVIVGQNIHDVAHLSTGFGTLGGQITFEVFAPGATTCQTPISVPPAQPVSGANDYTSGDFATSVVGTYRWIAHYSGDANNNAVDTKCNDANESSTVNPDTPTLTTNASGPVIVGSKIHDVAHLSAGFAPLGGSISFKVYAPGDTTCATPTAVTPDVPVSGANDYTSADFTTTQTGVYRWRAFYSGDSKNNAVSTPCNDANESSTVNPDTPTLTTNASGPVIVGSKIHDVAHLSAGFAPLGGSISFKVYAPGDTACATPTAVTPDVPVSGANDYTSADFTTTQTGVYRWRAFYSGDSNNNAVNTPCNDANESSTVNPVTPTLTTTASGPVIAGQAIHDVAHLSAGFAPLGGSISFKVYAPGDTACATPTAVTPDV